MFRIAVNPTVLRLGLVALWADIASEMLYPITPIFLQSVLGASFVAIGLIDGSALAVASFLRVFSGRISDRFGRRKHWVVAGYFCSAVAKPITGGAHNWLDVLMARCLDRFGKGIRTAPRDAWLADSVPKEAYGIAFGWHRGMDSVGAVLGPLLAVVYLSFNGNDLRSVYFWALIPALIAVLFVYAVPEKTVGTHVTNDTRFLQPLSREFKYYLVIWGLFSLTNSSDMFLLLRASKQGLSLTHVTLLYCLYNAVYAAGSPWLGALSDRFDRRIILGGGFLVFAMAYLGFGLANQTWQFAALFSLYGLYAAGTDGVGTAFASDLLPPLRRGAGLGWFGCVTGVAAIVASTVAGALWDRFGMIWPFVYGAAGGFLALLLLLCFPKRRGATS